MIKIIIVHGEKTHRTGKIHEAYIERLNKALGLTQKIKPDLIVLTGGRTREIAKSEAELGKEYLEGKGKGKIKTPLLLESRSRTTIENIRFTKKILEKNKIKAGEFFIITSQKRISRIKYLYKKIWPDIYKNSKFIGARDFYPFWFSTYEWLSLLLDTFDIKERFLLAFTKKMYRNN